MLMSFIIFVSIQLLIKNRLDFTIEWNLEKSPFSTNFQWFFTHRDINYMTDRLSIGFWAHFWKKWSRSGRPKGHFPVFRPKHHLNYHFSYQLPRMFKTYFTTFQTNYFNSLNSANGFEVQFWKTADFKTNQRYSFRSDDSFPSNFSFMTLRSIPEFSVCFGSKKSIILLTTVCIQ